MSMELQSLVKKYGAAKPEYYLPVYESLFAPVAGQRLNILEIGVHTGASLKVWENYFPKAKIVGIDLNPPKMTLSKRTTFLQGDQSNREFLQKVVKNHGPFHIIIDDGSHRPDHWFISYDELFPHIADGGYYIIEDLKAPFHDGWMPDQIEALHRRLTELAQPMLTQNGAMNIEWMIFRLHLLVIKKCGRIKGV